MQAACGPTLDVYFVANLDQPENIPITYESCIAFHKGFVLHRSSILNRYRAPFGSGQVWAIDSRYLTDMYGEDWSAVAKARCHFQHCSTMPAMPSPAGFVPAEPTGPLELTLK